MRMLDFAPFYRSTVGFDRFFSMLDQINGLEGPVPGYPPYNIERASEDRYRISVAVAGFTDDYWCYIPSRRVWSEGGYEGHTGMLECDLPGPFAPCVEEVIVHTVEELMLETAGEPRPYPRPSRHE